MAASRSGASALLGYSLLLGAGLAVSSPWWIFRMLTTRRYREGLPERLGRVPARVHEAARSHQIVWLHAVSVGEVLAASRLVHELEKALNETLQTPPWRVLVSTTTRTGQVVARERFGSGRVFWFPFDFAWSVRSWLRALNPRLLVLVESELWPRLLAEADRRGVPIAVVNARMSDRSFRRAQPVRRIWASVLRRVSLFLTQSEEAGRRLQMLGVPRQRVLTTGNLKYDIEPGRSPMLEALQARLGRYHVIVAGSLLEGEEDLLLEHWPAIHLAVPDSVLLLAPRHPERFHAVANKVERHFPLLLASRLLRPEGRAEGLERLRPQTVVLLDTLGDLASVYSLADVAFVGGSLVRKGGHNPLEPARLGIPVVIGPSFENFREIVAEMQAVQGLEVVQNGPELRQTLIRLLRDRVEADLLGQRGQMIFARLSGATRRSVASLLALIAESSHAGEAQTS